MEHKGNEKTIYYCYYSKKQEHNNNNTYVYKDIDNKGREIYCTEVSTLHPDIKISNFNDMKYVGRSYQKKGFIRKYKHSDRINLSVENKNRLGNK